MLKERAREISLIVAWVDALLLAVSFFSAYAIRAHILPRYLDFLEFVPIGGYLWLLAASLPLFHLLFRFFGVYDSVRMASFPDVVLRVGKPFLVAGSLLGSLIFLVQDKNYSRPIFLCFLGIYFLLVLAEKMCLKVLQNLVRSRGYNYRNILIVGTGSEGARLAGILGDHAHLGMRVIGHVTLNGDARVSGLRAPILGRVEDLKGILDTHVVDEVFFAVPARDLLGLEPHIWKCEEVGVRVHLQTNFFSTLLSRAYAGDIEGIPILTFSSTPQATGRILVKRLIDLNLASLALILLAPLMLLIAIAIKLTSSGPILYRQVRSGLNGRRFVLLKFCSMFVDAERQRDVLVGLNEVRGPVFKMRRDPRVTPVGRLLRKFSLDELPQLWNVVKGDMSLVGPRPPLPSEVERYERWQRRRLSMKPGVTCLWQVNGRSEVDFDTWMKLDMQYIDNWSLALDLWILLRTIPAVLSARGAH